MHPTALLAREGDLGCFPRVVGKASTGSCERAGFYLSHLPETFGEEEVSAGKAGHAAATPTSPGQPPRVRSQPDFLGASGPEAAGLEPFQRAQLMLLLLGEAPRLKPRRGSYCLSRGGDFSVLRKLLVSRLSEGP